MIADMFSELGAGVVDTDLVARNVVAPGEEGLRAVSEVFGDRVLNGSGELDLALLRNIVFNNAKERDRL